MKTLRSLSLFGAVLGTGLMLSLSTIPAYAAHPVVPGEEYVPHEGVTPIDSDNAPPGGRVITPAGGGNAVGGNDRVAPTPVRLPRINVGNALQPLFAPGEKIDVNKVDESRDKINKIINALKDTNSAYKPNLPNALRTKVDVLDNAINGIGKDVDAANTPAKVRPLVNRLRLQLEARKEVRAGMLNSFVNHLEVKIETAANRVLNMLKRLNEMSNNGISINDLKDRLNTVTNSINVARGNVNEIENTINSGNFVLSDLKPKFEGVVGQLKTVYAELAAIAGEARSRTQ